jgi:serpin B
LVGAAAVAQARRGRVPGAVEARPAAVRCVQAFTADLYRRLASERGNVVCSPYSAAVALAMTRNGARGRTATEMDRVLHAPALPVLNGGLNALASHIESRAGARSRADGSSAEVALGVANSLWGQQDFPWERAFLDALGRDYGAGPRSRRLRPGDEEARRRINGWVAERTRERIPS